MDGTLAAVGLAAAVAVVGMPHGGLDHLFGRAALEPLAGRWWRAAFLGIYLGVAGLVVAGWLLAPAATVALFFLVSAYHFGEADGRTGVAGLVEGGAVIWVPLLARPVEVAEILTWVVPGGRLEAVSAALGAARPLAWAAAALFAVLLLRLAISREWRTASRLAAFAAAFALLPVLSSFALFFCAWHSTRELADLARRADPARPGLGLARVLRLAAPRAALAVAGAGGAAWWFSAGREVTPVVVQAVFVGLSAVAVPHILLHAAARRLGADPFAGGSVPCPRHATT